MKILVVGNGGREHALIEAIRQSPMTDQIYCTIGNAGIAQNTQCIDIKADDIIGLRDYVIREGIDLTIVGPEAPLVRGIVDTFQEAGLRIFGPNKAAAQIEGSKVFAKELMAKYNIPTADFRIFDKPLEAEGYIDSLCYHNDSCYVVVKADGEALGKGVFVCGTRKEAIEAINAIMVQKIFPDAGNRIIIEERLSGREASFIVITDGENIVSLQPARDHKRAQNADRGPNTGGMGSYSPLPDITHMMYQEVIDTIIRPTLQAMRNEGYQYTGTLYTGIMFTKDGPMVLEYNCRFGDPETQAVLPLLDSDLLTIINDSLDGNLNNPKYCRTNWYDGCSVCVVIASGGYPGKYETGKIITGLNEANRIDGVTIYHAGTKIIGNNTVTNGGRVLGVTGIGDTFKEAQERAYNAVRLIKFDGMHYRADIASSIPTSE